MSESEERPFATRADLHWLALRLFRGLGSAELPVVRRHDMSLWGYEVLTLLIERPALSQVDIAAALDLDKNKVLRVVDELQASGFAARDADQTDRRRHNITATQAGREAHAAVAKGLQEIEEALLSALSPAQRADLRESLRHLVTVLDDSGHAPAPTSAM